MERYPIPAAETRVEIQVLNSRFIATAAPAFSVDEARAFIARVRAEMPGASHHVPAYVVGHGASVIAHSSDDGEPSGTAGRPALAVLHGADIGDVVIVITRYFGGTKLGTGGLVRAYSAAAARAAAAAGSTPIVVLARVPLALPFARLGLRDEIASLFPGAVLEGEYGADGWRGEAVLDQEQAAALAALLAERGLHSPP